MTTENDFAAIMRYYGDAPKTQKPRLTSNLEGFTITTTPDGLGDTLVLSTLPRSAAAVGRLFSMYSRSPHFRVLAAFNPYLDLSQDTSPFWAVADRLYHAFDLGPGHLIQRLQRAWGLPVDVVPMPCIEFERPPVVPRTFVLHLEPGSNVAVQRRRIHPRAREVYPETAAALQAFIRLNRDAAFYQVGTSPCGWPGVADWTGLPLAETIRRMATCEYFIGINSGPMHVAAGLGLKVIVIVNFPDPDHLLLPVLKDLGTVDMEWLYPQSVILHQDGAGPIVPQFSLASLQRAVDGEVYPYWLPTIVELGDAATELLS